MFDKTEGFLKSEMPTSIEPIPYAYPTNGALYNPTTVFQIGRFAMSVAYVLAIKIVVNTAIVIAAQKAFAIAYEEERKKEEAAAVASLITLNYRQLPVAEDPIVTYLGALAGLTTFPVKTFTFTDQNTGKIQQITPIPNYTLPQALVLYNSEQAKAQLAKMPDHYETLQVAASATMSEIRKAFRQLALQYHPDKNKDPNAKDIFQRINDAYEILSDEEKRRAYDAMRGTTTNSHSPATSNNIFLLMPAPRSSSVDEENQGLTTSPAWALGPASDS